MSLLSTDNSFGDQQNNRRINLDFKHRIIKLRFDWSPRYFIVSFRLQLRQQLKDKARTDRSVLSANDELKYYF
jgi:hypothetical protein